MGKIRKIKRAIGRMSESEKHSFRHHPYWYDAKLLISEKGISRRKSDYYSKYRSYARLKRAIAERIK